MESTTKTGCTEHYILIDKVVGLKETELNVKTKVLTNWKCIP